jgi:hypothetical protein
LSRTAQFSGYARVSHVYVAPLPAGSVLCSQQIQVYAQGGPSRTGMKANLLFFDRKPAAEKP